MRPKFAWPEQRSESVVLTLPQIGTCADAPTAAPQLSALETRRLAVLRALLAESRLSGDNDVDGALARLTLAATPAPPSTSSPDLSAFGVLLFHCLPLAAERRMTFFCRVCPNASADEWWLLRLVEALDSGDAANTAALLGFRIRKSWRRRIRFLVAGLAARL